MSGSTSYAPGPDLAFVGPGCALVLPADTGVAPAQIWSLVRDGAEVGLVLEALAAAGGMRAMGPFALLHGRRLVLRGAGRAVLAGTQQELTGTPFLTWAEHGLDEDEQVILGIGELHGPSERNELPLVAGVVHAVAVRVTAREVAGDLVPEPVARVLAVPPPGEVPSPAVQPVAIPAARTPDPSPKPAARRISVEVPPASPETIAPEWTGERPRVAASPGIVDGIPDFGGPPPEDNYDHLFGATVHRSLDEAGVHPQESEPEQHPAASPDTDHDGSTVRRADLGALRTGAPVTTAAPGPSQVLGLLCPRGHANPPAGAVCRSCGARLPDVDPVPIPRPSLGRLCVNDGSVAELDRSVLIGRSPTASRFSAGDLPHLLRVGGSKQDISRTHAEVRVEDWNVLVVDRSSNGTWLVRPGADPERLRKDQPVLVLPGSVLDLGDGVTIRYEVAP